MANRPKMSKKPKPSPIKYLTESQDPANRENPENRRKPRKSSGFGSRDFLILGFFTCIFSFLAMPDGPFLQKFGAGVLAMTTGVFWRMHQELK